MLKKIFIICAFILPIIVSAQRPSLPNTNPRNDYTNYNYGHGFLRSDLGYLTSAQDTNFSPIAPMMIYTNYNGGSYWFWNMVKWQLFASNSDLLNYVTTNTAQTISVNAPKIWNSTQTYNDTITSNNVIRNFIGGTDKNIFLKVDSLSNIGTDFSNSMSNSLRYLNYASKTGNYLPGILMINQRLSLNKQADTLPAMTNTGGALNPFISFIKRNSGDDTLNITNLDSAGAYKILSTGINVSTDSATIVQNNTFFNLKIPLTNIFSYTVPTFQTYLKEVVDADLGTTLLPRTPPISGSTNATIGKHTALRIEPLISGLNINQTAIAFDQQGKFDTIKIASQYIKALNVPLNATSTALYYTPSTGLISYGAAGSGSSTGNADSLGGIPANQYVSATLQFKTQTLTYGSTTTMNCNNGYNAKLTLTGNSTLAFTNFPTGGEITIKVIQDATGGRLLRLPANSNVPLGFGDGSGHIILTTTGGHYDMLYCKQDVDGNYNWTISKDMVSP